MPPKRTATKTPNSYHHGDLRRALLSTALEKVEAQGPEALSLAGLAKELGVSQTAPYRHFPDRDALLVAVASEAFLLFTQTLRAPLLNGDARQTRHSRLLQMGRAYFEFGTARPGIYRLMFASPTLASARDGALKNSAEESFSVLLDALDPSLRKETRERKAIHIWIALHGAVMLANSHLLGDQPAPFQLDRFLDDLLQ